MIASGKIDQAKRAYEEGNLDQYDLAVIAGVQLIEFLPSEKERPHYDRVFPSLPEDWIIWQRQINPIIKSFTAGIN